MVLTSAMPPKRMRVVHIQNLQVKNEREGKRDGRIGLISAQLCVRLYAQHFKCMASFECMAL